jgi:molybdenum cofactor cytidylyltransferase
MKASALLALRHIEAHCAPDDRDGWLLAPADMPHLSTAVIDALIAEHERRIASNESSIILAPVAAGKRGHPVLFPWRTASLVGQIEEGQGINRLATREGLNEVDVAHLVGTADSFADIDTPSDYGAMRLE